MQENDDAIFAAETTAATIYVQIIVDCDALMAAYPNPSQDYQHPTGIAHNQGFMVTSNEYVNSGQGTGDLSFRAEVGDTIRWTSSSMSNNFDSAVFVYQMNKFSGTQVTDTPELKTFTKTSMVPQSAIPPTVTQAQQNYWFMTCEVEKTGTEGYTVNFGLYRRVRGTSGQSLYGYFYWDPTITVTD
jgi:hypothetical protein